MMARLRDDRWLPVWVGVTLLVLASACSKQALDPTVNRARGGAGGSAGAAGAAGAGVISGTGRIDYSSCLPPLAAGGHPATVSNGRDGNTTAGAPTFTAGPPIAMPFNPQLIATADVNGDGRPDLVTVAESVSVALNMGRGAFASHIDTPLLSGTATALAIGDVNGDARPDIVVGGDWAPQVTILMNAGAGTFVTVGTHDAEGFNGGVALGDINGDGALDLIVANIRSGNSDQNGDLAVFLNDTRGTFGAGAHYPAGVEPRSVAVGDLNGDGLLDVAVGGTCGGVVLLNQGGGRLGTPTLYPGQGGPVAIADLDGDHKPDLVLTHYGTWNVDVMLNTGVGTFASPIGNVVEEPASTSVADVDGDGRPDLVVGTESGRHDVSVLLNQGGGSFAPPLNYSTGAGYSIALDDLNGDGKVDIALGGYQMAAIVLGNTSH